MSIIKSPTLILGVVPPHPIDQSIRFNDDDSPYMSRTPSGASNRKTFSFSCWLKLGSGTIDSGAEKAFFSARDGSSDYYSILSFNGDQSGASQLEFVNRNGGSYAGYVYTTQLFRDPSAWYHIVLNVDTTDATSSERIKLYVNGLRVTDVTYSAPSLNLDMNMNNNIATAIGARPTNNLHFDGYLAEIHFLDGYAYDPSYFGLFNDSGIWIPKKYSGSYGTNGFHIKGESASDLGNDSSGNNNDFTTSGLAAHDQVLDTPSNNFAVANPIHADSLIGSGTYAEGNLQVNYGSSIGGLASIAVSSGKWYAEWEIHSGSPNYFVLGIYGEEPLLNTSYAGKFANSYAYYAQDGNYYNNNVSNSYGNSYTVSDVIGIALDLDNNKLYFSKNGTFQNSGDPTSGSTGTGAISIASASSVPLGQYFIAGSSGSSAPSNHSLNYNFGQDGTFAGNVTAGGNSDGNGIGNFKYSVPSGFLALCTKNLGS